MSIESRVRNFLLENFLFTQDQGALQNGESLLERGIIDSTGVMEISAYIETEFGITIADSELLPENLDSVANIVAFVTRKLYTDNATALQVAP